MDVKPKNPTKVWLPAEEVARGNLLISALFLFPLLSCLRNLETEEQTVEVWLPF